MGAFDRDLHSISEKNERRIEPKEKQFSRGEVMHLMLSFGQWILPHTEQDVPKYVEQIKKMLDEKA